jgi:hypothetical protein
VTMQGPVHVQFSTVIPAKAGIQERVTGAGACGPWMPAFAGMTKKGMKEGV